METVRLLAALRATDLRLKTLEAVGRGFQRRYPDSSRLRRLSQAERESENRRLKFIRSHLKAALRHREVSAGNLVSELAIDLSKWKKDAEVLEEVSKLVPALPG